MDQEYQNQPQTDAPQYDLPQQPEFRPQPAETPAPKGPYRAIYQYKIPQAEAPQPAEPQADVQPSDAQPFESAPPAAQLKTNRSLAKFILLSIVTLGIYGLVVMCGISKDINTIASRYDNKKTMHFAPVILVFSWLTLGIVPLIWYHRLSGRIGAEMLRRRIPSDFGAKDFWLWGILGALIIVGPFIYAHRLLKNMNLLAQDYNMNA